MPELPEVETVKNILLPLVKGKTIHRVEIYFDRLILSNLNEFKSTLKGQTILDISRYGKFLFIKLTNDLSIISHLRMEGKYRYVENVKDARIKHTSATFFFNDSTALSYDDTRKFGIMKLVKTSELYNDPMICKLGVEANKVTPNDMEVLYKKFNRNKNAKELLLDQTILCGIGNIYANEILYESYISPYTKGKDLTKENIDDIVKNAKIILDKAITMGGSTIHSFHPSEGVDGKFQITLKCYGKEGTPCPRCGTTIHKDFIGQRGTTYCPNCQINKELEKAIGITGPVSAGKSTALKHLATLGYTTISCDDEIHKIYRDPKVKYKLGKILQTDFDVNDPKKKKIITSILINNPDKKKELEAYVYPILEAQLIQYIKENELIVIEVPLLFKAHFEYMFKTILVIETDKENVIRNLEGQGKNVETYLKLNQDWTYDMTNKKIKIIKNNGDLQGFYSKIEENL